MDMSKIIPIAMAMLWIISPHLYAQEPSRHTISGTVRAKGSGESIIRATVTVEGKNIGVTTNDYGFYSITLPQGKYTLIISAVGWETHTIDIELNGNLPIQTQLVQQDAQLQEATVTAQGKGR